MGSRLILVLVRGSDYYALDVDPEGYSTMEGEGDEKCFLFILKL